MAKQPKKSSIDYQKNFSAELKNFINKTIYNDILLDVNIGAITPMVFLAGIFSDKDCMGYKVINTFLTTVTIDDIYKKLYNNIESDLVKRTEAPDFSIDCKYYFSLADKIRAEMDCAYITTDHVLMAYLKEKKDEPAYDIISYHIPYSLLEEKSKKTHESIDAFKDIPNSNEENGIVLKYRLNSEKKDRKKNIYLEDFSKSKYCTNLNDKAAKNKIDKLIGREKEVNHIIRALNRKRTNNVLLIGESGVGKTAIVEGMAKMIVDNECHYFLKDYQIFSLDRLELISSTEFRGTFEEHIKELISYLEEIDKAILFIDNIHIFFTEKESSSFDHFSWISELFKSDIKVIAATTPKGLHMIEKNPQMLTNFQKIKIEDMNEEECFNILDKIKKDYEKHHNVKFSKDIIKLCMNLSKRFVSNKALLPSVIDIIDETGSAKGIERLSKQTELAREINDLEEKKDIAIKTDWIYIADEISNDIERKKLDIIDLNEEKEVPYEVTANDIYESVSNCTGIPVKKLNESEKKIISQIDKRLKESIIGQDEVIDVVSQAIKRNKAGLYFNNKPILSTLCIGTTGCGKTLLAKTLAKEIFGDEKNLVRFDMSEYSDETSVNKLIGASAGYVGYTEGGLLTEAVKNKSHSVVLFDEIEKANDKIFNIFLQILDEGFLTDNMGVKVDFKNTIIIMTSNIGTKRAYNEKGIGFNINSGENKKDIIEKELKQRFSPEFINRFDEISYFNCLSEDNLKSIIKLELKHLKEKLSNNNIILNYDNSIIEYLFNKTLPEKEYGARPIVRIIQKEIENKITDILLMEENDNVNVKCTVENSQLILKS